MNRRAFLQLAVTGAAVVAAPAYGLAEARRFSVTRHARALPGLRGALRVAQLSDLHYGRWHREDAVRAWVDAANDERPDLTVITGDLVDTATSNRRLAALAAELARLEAPLGVHAVLGNHDYTHGADNPDRRAWMRNLTGAIRDAGVRLHVNDGERVRADLHLAGLDDLWNGRPDLERTLEGSDGDHATVLLSHNPDVLPDVPGRVGLTLAGHTHGGQVRLPFIGALDVPSRYGKRFIHGFVCGPATGYVSRGLGTTGPPVRVLCPAELAVFELHP